jgi:hypothetical protein
MYWAVAGVDFSANAFAHFISSKSPPHPKIFLLATKDFG